MFRPIRALFLGPPGSGKGTLTGRLIKDIPALTTISSGDVLRTNIAQKTAIGLEAEKYIKGGHLVPDSTMIGLITGLLAEKRYLDAQSSWILDGFPRTNVQAGLLDEVLHDHKAPLNCVVWLNVPKSVIIERIENRFIHAPSGRVYNLTYNPPKVPGKDDLTGEPLTKRADDTVELWERRFADYEHETYPLVDHYKKTGNLHEFQGVSSDAIYPELLKFMQHNYKAHATEATAFEA